MSPTAAPYARLADVSVLILDVDGVLTDGRLFYAADGEALKVFDVHDGMGVTLLRRAGVEVAVVTARDCEALRRRVQDLGISHAAYGCRDKAAKVRELSVDLGVALENIAYVGDDAIDVPALRLVGVPITVANAHPTAVRVAAWTTSRAGGRGAVREVADAILAAREGASGTPTTFLIVIPARFASTRLPGKPLVKLRGRPMLAYVVERAQEAGASQVVVAVDDRRVEGAARKLGVEVEMTAPEHTSGTDRVAEVAQIRRWSDDTIVVNLQGDEPCMDPALLRKVADALHAHPEAGIATLATPIRERGDAFDPNIVKVAAGETGRALYFSRAPIPWLRGRFPGGDSDPWEPTTHLRHLGIYAYRVGTLRAVAGTRPSPLELAESLEQLRALEMGVGIHVEVISEAPGHGVDTPEDVARVEELLAGRQEQRT